MKYISILSVAALAMIASTAQAAIYAKYDGVSGESKLVESTLSLSGAISVESATVYVGSSIVLDASKSVDDGVVRTFSWKQVSGPTLRISEPKTVAISVVPTVAGTYEFELVVSDSNGRVYKTFRYVLKAVAKPAPSTTNTGTVQVAPLEASDMYLKIDTIEGESSESKKGNVEMNWKVEEGESAAVPGVEPDEIDVDDDGEPITPDFSILLGGSSDDDEEAQSRRDEVADILLKGAQEEGMPAEQISMNFEKIKTKVVTPVKLFGVLPVSARATVEIDAEERVTVKFPWWAFLASGKEDKVELGERVFTTLSNVLKTKHDTIKNSIGNVR